MFHKQDEDKSDALTALPSEMVTNGFIPCINLESTSAAMQTCKGWLTLFDSPEAWDKRIEVDFGIPPTVLNRFKEDVRISRGITGINSKSFYQRLLHLRKIKSKLPTFIRYSYDDPQFHLQLLTCCLNDASYAKQVLPFNEYGLWIVLSLYAGFNEIVALACEENIDHYFFYALFSGNLTAAQQLYPALPQKVLVKNHFDCAAGSGSIPALEWVIDKSDQTATADEDTMILAAESASIEMLELLKTRYKLELDAKVYRYAVKTGKKTFIDSFCSQSAFRFPLAATDVEDVAYSGNVDLLKQSVEKFKLPVVGFTHSAASQSGKVEVLKYTLQVCSDTYNLESLLNWKQSVGTNCSDIYNFENLLDWKPSVETNTNPTYAQKQLTMLYAFIAACARSGCLEMVKYCHEQLGMPITRRTFEDAVEAGNMLLVDYLRTKFRFNLADKNPLIANFALVILITLYKKLTPIIRSLSDNLVKSNRDILTSDEVSKFNLPIIQIYIDALHHPEEYELNENGTNNLIQLLSEMTSIKEYGLIERNAIKTMLGNFITTTNNEALRNAAEKIAENFTASYISRGISFPFQHVNRR